MSDDATATVLIVDDDEGVRLSLGALLEAAGYRTKSFATALEFFAAAKSVAVGCGIVDVGLPDMDGLVLQELLSASGSRLPVVIVTGRGEVPLAVKAMRAGAVDFLEKPYAPEALLASVRRALELSGHAGEEAADPGRLCRERLSRLTPRERDVLVRVVAGKANKIIAYELGISPRTVELHRARVMAKMEADSLPDLVRLALAAGIRPAADG